MNVLNTAPDASVHAPEAPSQVSGLITRHLDLWSSAQQKKSASGRGSGKKIDLYGIKKLRELILELAVRGKLVPQNPADEPAAVLLQRIAEEKARLVAEKKIKKQKPLPPISDEEKPFELPEGWEWARLGDISTFVNGFAFKSQSFQEKGVGIVKIGDITSTGEISEQGMSRVSDKIVSDLDSSLRVENGDLVIAMSGATTGKLGFNNTDEVYYLNQRVGKIISHIVNKKFIYLTLTTKISENLDQSMGSAIPNLSTNQINNIVIAVPTLTEQHRIVAKVDELMALCDQLEQQSEASISAHATLVETLLATLTNSASATELEQNWQRIAAHFDTLFTTEHSIDQLKQTVLQLAVMGKLVPQDPTDEPASVLLERIAEEKARLVKEKKIKKQKPLPPITDEEKPFELPEGWEWCRLQQITSKITDGDHKTPPRIETGRHLLSAKNVRNGYLDLNNCDYISDEDYEKSRERCCPETGDLLVVSVGGTIGRSSLVPKDAEFALVRSVALIKPLLFSSNYLKHSMDSKLLQDYIHGNKRGGAQPCLYLSEISKFLFAMPPEPEQHRIVAKVDQLMSLCDQLKDRIQVAQQTQLHLADALVEQAVS